MEEYYQHKKKLDFKRAYLVVDLGCSSSILIAIDVSLQIILTSAHHDICNLPRPNCLRARQIQFRYREHLLNRFKQSGWDVGNREWELITVTKSSKEVTFGYYSTPSKMSREKGFPDKVLEKMIEIYPDYNVVWNPMTNVEFINYMMIGLEVGPLVMKALMHARTPRCKYEDKIPNYARNQYFYKIFPDGSWCVVYPERIYRKRPHFEYITMETRSWYKTIRTAFTRLHIYDQDEC